MTYDDLYRQITYKLCRGYIMRKEPKNAPRFALERYNAGRNDVYAR